jgi:hypothetical protein
MIFYTEPERKIPVREFDVVVAGGGTAGVVAAIAASRTGATTALIEGKGYVGGIVVEGGTALHSYYNLWKAFPGVEKRQIVKGIPQEIVDRLEAIGGTTGHAEMTAGYDYDSVNTAVDTEAYKLVAFQMLEESGVKVFVNTFCAGAIVDGGVVRGAIVESRSGREAFYGKSFVDSTGYGDLAAHCGARFTEPNDHPVANSIGVGGVSLEGFHEFLESHNAIREYSEGFRSGKPGRIVRLHANAGRLPNELVDEAKKIGMALVTTTTHDDYFMFIKLNYKMPVSPTDRDETAKAEHELRERQQKAIGIIQKWFPGCERAFVARTSPSLSIRRGRCIECDYDISSSDVLDGRHFEDDIMSYGFHDCAPRLQIKNGGTYGIPYRALRVLHLENLLAAGMLITSDWDAHMSTRNTVACMGQGQAAGTAAALCAAAAIGTRDLDSEVLRQRLLDDGVYLE